MKRKFTRLTAALALLVGLCIPMGMWGQAPVGTTLWGETWTGGDANETPSAYGFEGTTVYGGATLTYAQSSTNTKLYEEALAGGESPELLLSKSNQTWTISNIPTGQATGMALSFNSNKTTFDVTSTTTGITISGSQKSWTIATTSSVTTFNLTIKNTGSSNARIDDIVLSVTTAGGDTPQPTTYTVTYECNGGTSGCPQNVTGIEPNTQIQLADAPSKDGFDFAGWSDGNTIYDENEDYTVNGNVTFTAQWTENTTPSGETATLNIQAYAEANEWVSGTKYATATVAPVTFTANGGGNTGKYYSNGQDWRFYQNESASITISVAEGYTLVSVKPTYTVSNTGVLKNGNATIASGTTVSVSGTSVTFTVGNSGTATNGQVRFTNIDVVYVSNGGVIPPSISAENVSIEYDAVSGSIAYTINNEPDPVGTLAAAVTDGDWLTLSQGTVSPITFTCTPNQGGDDRTATVTLTYAYGDNQTATKDVTVTQAGDPNVTPTIAEVRAQGTGNVVTRGIVTSCVGTTGYIQDATAAICVYGTALTVGDEIRVSGSLSTFHGLLEITDPTVTVISSGNTVNPELMTIAQVVASTNQGWYIRIEEATVTAIDGQSTTIAQGDNTIVVYGISGVEIAVDDVISLNGNIGNHDGVQVANPQNVEVQAEPSVTVIPSTINAPAEGAEGTLTVTYESITEVAAEVWFCDAAGTTTATYDWITATINSTSNNVDYHVVSNNGEARTAYFKVWAYDDEFNEVYSNLVTINQAAPVGPLSGDGMITFGSGEGDTKINGASVTGEDNMGNTWTITTDGNNPYFAQNDDYSQVGSSNKPATSITFTTTLPTSAVVSAFEAKFGGFNGTVGDITLKVGNVTVGTGSLNGSDVVTVSNTTAATGTVLTVTVTNIAKGVKCYYISYTLGENTDPYITLVPLVIGADPYLIECDYHNFGWLAGVEYGNFIVTDANDFHIQFYDADGQPIDRPNWVDGASVKASTEGYELECSVVDNYSDARSAYFKVYANVSDTEAVYSDLVTVHQAGAPQPSITLTFDDDPHSYTPESPYQIVFSEWSDGGPVVRVEYDNFPFALGAQDFQIQHCNADGEATDVIPDWFISNTPEVILFSDNLLYVKVEVSANEGDARTAYFKVWAYDANQHPVYSDLVTVTQSAPVVDYAVLPFEWEGGARSAFEALNGTSTYSVGDYTNTQQGVYKMKLDDDGDYIQVKTNEQPGKVTIGVKMIGGKNTSTITVQGSADGETFTDIEVLEISGAQNDELTLQTTNVFDENDRYVRMLFTKGSNVGVGPITIAKVVPYITLVEGDPDPYQLEYSAGSHAVNAAGVDYGGFVVSGETPFSIEYCDENGDPIPAWPNWLSFEVVPAYTWWTYSPYVLTGNIQQNDNASPRTAYFKVKAQNGAATVYSDMVTLRQAGMHDLNVTLADNVNAIFVFDAADQNNPLIADGAAGTVRVSGGISILVSPDVAEGYVLESLMINNENVISQLDESGAYTFTMPEGDVTITATAVEYVPAANQYVKVTTAADLTSGQYLIVYEDGSLAFDGSLETLDAEGNTFEVVINGDRIDINNIAAESEFTIDMTEGTIRSASGYYIGRTVDDNGIQTSLTIEYENAISIDEAGNANVVSSGGAYLRYNAQAERFRYYKSGTYTGQEAIQLYKKVGDAPASETYILENITGYSGEKDNYSLIASPVYVRPANVEGMIIGDYDLYYFDQEQEKEWRNYEEKRFYIVPGMGYLYAKKATTETAAYSFEFEGTPYNGDGEVALKYIENAQFPGFNLIGNPFGKKATLSLPHYSLNEEGSALNAYLEETEVEVMEGVFVQASVAGQSALFTPVTRGNHAVIAHTNIMLSNNMGSVLDNAIIRFDNGAMLGKFQLNPNSTTVYFTEGNHDYAIVSSEAQGEMPVNFKAENNGTYTIAVEPKNVEMTYLHLIDNLTGADIDLLAEPSYTFEAKTNDYASRFRLVFSANEGSNENATETFAFFNGSEWQISNVGEATLQVVDMMGRVLSSETISGNAEVNINQAAGIYMLRLVNGDDVKVQKVVVR